MVGNKSAKLAKKTSTSSSHHKKRTLKAKTSSATSAKSKTSVDQDGVAAKSDVDKSKVSADRDTTAAVSKANDGRCAEAAKSPPTADTNVGVVDTTTDDKNNTQAVLPQSSATHKPNIIFIHSINSFRYTSEWYSPSKVLP